MGVKGARLTEDATSAMEQLVSKLSGLGEISSKKMFGGYSIFESQKMFALVDSQGRVFFKTDSANRPQYEQAGSLGHARMPYHQVPSPVLDDPSLLHDWARQSINLARQT